MGWGETNDLHFNVGELRAQADAVSRIREDLESSQTRLTENLNLLRTEWVSDASKKFFSMYDTSWVKKIDKYCSMLYDLEDALRCAAAQYEPLESEYNHITLG